MLVVDVLKSIISRYINKQYLSRIRVFFYEWCIVAGSKVCVSKENYAMLEALKQALAGKNVGDMGSQCQNNKGDVDSSFTVKDGDKAQAEDLDIKETKRKNVA